MRSRPDTPAISVVLPTRNRCHLLARALGALAEQKLAPHDFEVIVVSDGCSDETEAVVASFQQRLRNLRFHAQPPRGPAAARNRGIALARAPIVAFTDDDCVPGRDWLHSIVECFGDHPDALGVEGKTTTVDERVTPLTHQVVNLRGGFSRPTCNVSYAMHVLLRVGGFDESFPFNGEDEDMALTVSELGPIAFCERAEVAHPPRALYLGDHLRQMARLEQQAMLAQFRLAAKHPSGYRRLRGGGPWRALFYLTAWIKLRDLWQQRGWLCKAPDQWLAAALLLVLRMCYRVCLVLTVCLKLKASRRRSAPASWAGRAEGALAAR